MVQIFLPKIRKSKNVVLRKISGLGHKEISTLTRSRTFLASKRHWLLPSSSMKFHHRRPTSRRPDIFFTTQKSNERRRTIIMKPVMKLSVTKFRMKQIKMASARKKTWKNAARGCLEDQGSVSSEKEIDESFTSHRAEQRWRIFLLL